jgi:hypothetical protein
LALSPLEFVVNNELSLGDEPSLDHPHAAFSSSPRGQHDDTIGNQVVRHAVSVTQAPVSVSQF